MPDAAAYESLHDIVAARRSVRRFKPAPVSRELVEKVLEVARLSPSAANSQPWEFVVVEDADIRRNVALAAASVFADARKKDPTFEWSVSVQPFLFQAPVIILVLGDRRMLPAYPTILRGNVLLRQSLSICVYGLQLAAASLGLATAWGTLQGGAAEAGIREMLGIPDVFTIDHIVPLGYADEVEGARATALEPARSRAPHRRSLDEVVHWGRFDEAKRRSDEAAGEFIWSETVTRVRRQA
ncbi:MAG: nitroreductase family protein [Dehalococcoidia bacterium]|nr:nitroreductase family protein [Dehalococcoidia bacterium]